MCMTFIFISDDPNSKYKLIILNNRDESIDRPTLELDWRNGVLSGTDIQDPAKGTWFGTNKLGRVGILLSITQPASTIRHGCPSRGAIAKDYLESATSSQQYFNQLSDKAHLYNGFQFLGLERNDHDCYEMTSLTSMFADDVKPRVWPSGTYVWGNSPPEKPYLKVVEGKKLFEKFVSTLNNNTKVEEIIQRLLEIGTNETRHCPDPQLALQTGRPLESYQYFCSIMVKFPIEVMRYGTRSHSILIVDKEDNATFYEKRMSKPPQVGQAAEWLDKTVTFKLEPVNI
ncbi:hypothetical protein Aduo_017135 [Ancylostoma duodenale]